MMDRINSDQHKAQPIKSSNHRHKSSPVLLRSKSTAPSHPVSTMGSPHSHKNTSKAMDLRRSISSRSTKNNHRHGGNGGSNRNGGATGHGDDSMIVYGKNPECSEAIRAACLHRPGLGLGLQDFTALKKLGYGDIGSVYLVELKGALPRNHSEMSSKHSKCWFAMKMMDKELLETRRKVQRVHTERDILRTLDHPFLPTLYADFETERFACLVIEFCAGGDLHALRQKQPCKHFSESAARFYAAEVLLSLEYLHMKGVIYRDLKPENILIREDGHIMLSDFDLSLQCAVKPTLLKSCSVHSSTPSTVEKDHVSQDKYPLCMQPPCFSPKMLLRSAKSRLRKNEPGNQVSPLPEVFVEPMGTKSMSFVGTYEYIAPEVIIGEGHGSAVDWWTFGILLYELLYGTTPFKGQDNKATLLNILGKPLQFPEIHNSSLAARDLIRGLLVKDPEKRLGYTRGASEIKQHPFFKGINWALIRSLSPPEVPMPFQMSSNSLLREMEKSDFGF